MFRNSTSTKTLGSRKSGTFMMVSGGLLAGLATMLVLSASRQAQAAQTAPRVAVREAQIVVATKEIAELTTIKADAVALKPFPADYLPAGAATKVEDVIGKVASSKIVPQQVVLKPQLSTTAEAKTPSLSIPKDKVVFWMALPEVFAQGNALRQGDKVDILLSVAISPAATQNNQSKNLSTQTTLQAVEVYAVGTAQTEPAAQNGQNAASATAKAPAKQVALLLDPQDAVVAKFVKDSNGTIDLVLRSRETTEVVPTEAVTADTLVDRFGFKTSQRWTAAK
jgi:Flp pilus assembly protein CpaB